MSEEEKKTRYRNLLYSVNSIYYEINNLYNDINSLETYLTENFTINNKIAESEKIYTIQETTNNIKSELSRIVLPSIRSKSY